MWADSAKYIFSLKNSETMPGDYSSLAGFITTPAPATTGAGRASHAIRAPLLGHGGVVEAVLNGSTGFLEIRAASGEVTRAARGWRGGGRSAFYLSLKGRVPKFRRSFLDTQKLAFLGLPNSGIFVFDLFYLTHPDNWSDRILGRVLYRGLRRYPMILTCSEYTRATLQERLKIPPERIRVVPLDCDRTIFRPMEVDKNAWLSKYGLPIGQPLLAHISSGEKRKNLLGVLDALRLLTERFPGIALIKAGKVLHGENQKILQDRIHALGLRDHVFFLEGIPDSELAALYNVADCFLFPSLAEGFGLPVLEAQACGCPVVTSNTTSLREVAGPLCRAVNPLDAGAISDAIADILSDPEFRSRHAAANKNYLERFSWEPARQAVCDWLL